MDTSSSSPSPSHSLSQPPSDSNDTQPTASNARDSRFITNKVVKAWLIYTLLAEGAPLQKMKTLEGTCARVAHNAANRHIPDQEVVKEQEQYGMHWRRAYMRGIAKSNVQYLVSTIAKLARNVPVEQKAEEGGNPVAAVREGCKEDGGERLLDQAILDFKQESGKRTESTDDDPEKSLARRKQSRKEKQARLDKRKAEYARCKKEREEQKRRKQEERRAVDVQNVKAQTMTANAAAASVSIAARQCEQFGAFLALYARRYNLSVTQPTTPMPASLQTQSLELDESLLKSQSISRNEKDSQNENNTTGEDGRK